MTKLTTNKKIYKKEKKKKRKTIFYIKPRSNKFSVGIHKKKIKILENVS